MTFIFWYWLDDCHKLKEKIFSSLVAVSISLLGHVLRTAMFPQRGLFRQAISPSVQ